MIDVIRTQQSANSTFAVDGTDGDFLIVAISTRANPSDPQNRRVIGVTYDGIAMTRAAEFDNEDGGNDRIHLSIWHLANPSSGSNNVVVSTQGGIQTRISGAAVVSGIDTTTPIDGIGTGTTDSSGSLESSVSASTVGALVIDSVLRDGNTTLSSHANQTDVSNINDGTRVGGASYKIVDSAGSKSMTWAAGSSGPWAALSVAYKPAYKPAAEKAHTTDSLLITRSSKTHTTDSLLLMVTRLEHSTDSTLDGTAEVNHTTDSYISTSQSIEHTTDSTLRRTQYRDHSTDSLIQKSAILYHSTDSLLRASLTRMHTTDSYMRSFKVISHTTDSTLDGTAEVVHTTDSFISTSTRITHTTDSTLRKEMSVSHTTDSLAYLRRYKAHTSDSFLYIVSEVIHATDSLLRRTQSRQHTTDSLLYIVREQSHGTDSYLYIVRRVEHSTDASLKKTLQRSHSTDSFILKVIKPDEVHSIKAKIVNKGIRFKIASKIMQMKIVNVSDYVTFKVKKL